MTAITPELLGKGIYSASPIVSSTVDEATRVATVITRATGNADSDSRVTVEWQRVDYSETLQAAARAIAEKFRAEFEVWKVQPQEAERLAGQFFVTSYPRNGVEGEEGKVRDGSDEPEFILTAWYAPPFCSTGDLRKWYVMSDRPLHYVKSDFRSWLADGGVGGIDPSMGRSQ